MKRAWIVVLLLAGTVGAQSDKAPVDYPTMEEALKHGSPSECLAMTGAGRYRSVSCNAGGAYQVFTGNTTSKAGPCEAWVINGKLQASCAPLTPPKRTGEFHPQCRYKLDNGDSEVGDCPESNVN